MGTNKITPFLLAIIIHLLPLSYFLFKKKAPPLFSYQSSHEVDLNHFSIKKNKLLTNHNLKNLNPQPNTTSPLKLTEDPPANTNTDTDSDTDSDSDSNTNPNSSMVQTDHIFSFFINPSYPQVARKKGIEGTVKIKIYFQDGKINKTEIIKSSGAKILDEAVIKTASSWKINNQEIGTIEKTFTFKLNN